MFRPAWVGRRLAPSLLTLAAVASTGVAPASAPASTHVVRATTAKVAAAKVAYVHADRSLVATAKRLSRCELRRGGRCTSLKRDLQRSGHALSRAQRRLPRTVLAHAAYTRGSRKAAPVVTLSGQTLSWRQVADVTSYILVTKVPGKADAYSVVNGTSVTPPAVPGQTVAYSVRTQVVGSTWSNQVSIAYPADLTAARQAAPTMTVDGQTIRWNQVADVTRYVFVTKAPGYPDKYEYVNGTSYTPPAYPGLTVRYGLSTDVSGAQWAQEVSVTYPASTTTTTATTPTTTTTTSTTSTTSTTTTASAPTTTSSFHMGIVSGSAIQWQLSFIQLLGAKHVRMEFDIKTPVADMEPIIRSYAEAGIQPLLLAGFYGRSPTVDEAKNLGEWAKAFGPGGYLRQSTWPASTAVRNIEFGNESNGFWQYSSLQGVSDWPHSQTYIDIIKQYALRFRDARQAIDAANPNVGLLAIADEPGRWAVWMDTLFSTVPEFGSLVSGWVVHPYGTASAWQLDIDDAMAKAAAHGASNNIPIYATEYGFAVDNGNCLNDNYGWSPCMTYDQAATNLHQTIADMKSRYGSRLAELYLYSTSDLATTGTSTNRENYFGALRSDKTSKGAYTTEVKAQLAAGA